MEQQIYKKTQVLCFKQHLPVLTKFRTFRQEQPLAWASFAPMLLRAFSRHPAN
jgi:hypothetical protein